MHLISNNPSRFASSHMAIKETCVSVSFTILAPSIKTVDLILRCLSSLSWHKYGKQPLQLERDGQKANPEPWHGPRDYICWTGMLWLRIQECWMPSDGRSRNYTRHQLRHVNVHCDRDNTSNATCQWLCCERSESALWQYIKRCSPDKGLIGVIYTLQVSPCNPEIAHCQWLTVAQRTSQCSVPVPIPLS